MSETIYSSAPTDGTTPIIDSLLPKESACHMAISKGLLFPIILKEKSSG